MSKSRKISKEEKLAMVKRCLSGEFGVCEAGRQTGVSQESIRRWIHRFKAEGEAGLTAVPMDGFGICVFRRGSEKTKKTIDKFYLKEYDTEVVSIC